MGIGAMIMAGGEGSRLRPMTMHLPKPLVPLMGKPVMGYALELVKKHGIQDVGVTLWYQPKKIRAAFGRGEKMGMRIQYFEEIEPLGTAGSIKLAADRLKNTFFVLSGDGLTDCDLTRALQYHKERKAMATLVLKREKIPLPYGVVMTQEDGRIIRFVEKPDWSGVYSNLVNTGIYILEPELLSFIPDNGMPDFGRDIFPALLKNKVPLYGYEMDDYWCDVGNPRAYLQAQEDLLAGKVHADIAPGIHPEAIIGDHVHLQGHFFIGKGAVIENGAIIRNAVIGDYSTVGKGAVIENSCLWKHTAVGAKARVQGSVLCDRVAVRGETVLEEGCVLGQGTSVGAHAHLQSNVKVWPGIKVPAGAVCSESLFREEGNGCIWEEDGAMCRWAGCACRLAMAFAQAVHPKHILTGHYEAQALQTVISGALGTVGVTVMHGGWMTESMLREAVVALKADGGILAAEDKLIFVDRNGRRIGNNTRRNMDALLLCNDLQESGANSASIRPFEGARELYLSAVLPENESKAMLSPVTICCSDSQLKELVMDGLRRLHVCNVRCVETMEAELRADETVFMLTNGGRMWSCFMKDGEIEKTQLNLLRLKYMQDVCGIVYDLPDMPRAAAEMMSVCLPDDSAACCKQERRLFDGVAAIWTLCTLMKKGLLKEQIKSLPDVHMAYRDVDCPEGDKSRILYELCRHTALPYTLSRGMQVKDKRGYATIVPDQNRPAVRIFSEAASMETATELCDFYDNAIRMTLQGKTDF